MPIVRDKKQLMSASEIDRTLVRLAHEILEKTSDLDQLAFIGIKRRGVPLAQRLASKIESLEQRRIPTGILDINLYRDDRVTHEMPESQIPVDIADRLVVIIDDVLFTGRTIRAALDAVTDLGRPSAIRLCVFIDRGLRELPVQPDYVGRFIPTSRRERIKVTLSAQPAQTDEVVVLAHAP